MRGPLISPAGPTRGGNKVCEEESRRDARAPGLSIVCFKTGEVGRTLYRYVQVLVQYHMRLIHNNRPSPLPLPLPLPLSPSLFGFDASKTKLRVVVCGQETSLGICQWNKHPKQNAGEPKKKRETTPKQKIPTREKKNANQIPSAEPESQPSTRKKNGKNEGEKINKKLIISCQ
jgi:hypothetical protein